LRRLELAASTAREVALLAALTLASVISATWRAALLAFSKAELAAVMADLTALPPKSEFPEDLGYHYITRGTELFSSSVPLFPTFCPPLFVIHRF